MTVGSPCGMVTAFAGSGAGEQAGGAFRLDHHDVRRVRPEPLAGIGGDGGCEAADARLQEDVRRRLEQRVQRLADRRRIALHHRQRDRFIAFPRGVGDHGPAFPRGGLGRDAHGIVIAAGDAAHIGAEGGHRVGPRLRDAGMDEDHRRAAGRSGAPGDRAAMIAVGGAGDGHARSDSADIGRGEVGRRELAAELALGFGEHQRGDRIGAAQRLEAAQAEPLAFVLDMDQRNTVFRGKRRQRDQRRRPIGVERLQIGGDRCPPGSPSAAIRCGRGWGLLSSQRETFFRHASNLRSQHYSARPRNSGPISHAICNTVAYSRPRRHF